MLAIFRRFLNTWPARVFFGLLVISFGMWGVGDVVRNIASDTSLARVAGVKIEVPEFQEAYRRQLAQATRMLGTAEPTPEIRRAVALQTVSQLVTQKALSANARDLGVAVPEEALAAAVQEVPQFRDQQGKYDATVARQVLRNNGLNESTFAAMLGRDLAQRQVLEAVTAGAVAPAEMAREVFEFQQEKRVADAVEVLFAAAAPAPTPTPAQVERWWANHPEKYSKPEYRRIKAIVLAPQTLASEIAVSDEDIKAAWDQHKAEFNTPERRTVQVILTQDAAEAQKLAADWSTGADWATMQAEAAKTAAAPVELADAALAEFPAPELGAAVFATPPDVVPPPVHSALGWHVLKVVKITPGGAKTAEEAHDALKARVIAEKAADLMYDRANRIENLLSAGTALDDLPGDLGIAAVTGTLDKDGTTPEGQPAPIPGPTELRPALLEAAFAAKQGDQPKLTQGPNGADGSQSFFALSVEQITPPAPKPLEAVADQVRADWATNEQHRAQEEVAASIFGSTKRGLTIAAAAEKAGLPVNRLPPAGRASPPPGFPSALLTPLFGLRQGETTMVETPTGYVVATLHDIQLPDPKADPVGYGQVQQALARAIGEDIQSVYATAVRDRSSPTINQTMVESLAAPSE